MSSRQRGAALLIALATLILAVSAATILARAAASAKAAQRSARSVRLTHDLLPAVESPIIHWLDTHSGEVVLPSDATAPAVTVLHDRIVTELAEYEITITAFDECGRAPLALLRSASPLRSAVPVEVLQVVDESAELSEPVGLDSLGDEPNSETEDWPLFPQALDSEAPLFGSVAQEEQEASDRGFSQPPPMSIGSIVSTHSGDPPAINVNTAPLPLIGSALRLTGRGGLEQIAAGRDAGKLTSVGALSQLIEPQSSAPTLCSSSNAWAFRIDLLAGRMVRSWWAIYVKDESDRRRESDRSGSPWRCVQRCAIVE